jgi:hypothetical protein
MNNKDFLEKIKENTDLTASEIGEHFHIDKSSLSKMQQGKLTIPDPIIAQLATEAGLDPITTIAALKGGRWLAVKKKLASLASKAAKKMAPKKAPPGRK